MRTILKKNLLAFIFLWITCTLSAQVITGNILDNENKKPLPFANLVLLNASDSTYIKGTVSNEEGEFSLGYSSGSYLVKASFVGYYTQVLPLISDNMGSIHLVPEAVGLSEVVVTGKMFRIENGGIAADIQNSSILKNMGSVTEIVGEMPFVIKSDNSFTVFGKGSPVFYVNNRRVRDLSELEQINVSEVKRVTVITNPGVEYDASVNAVIKIETIRPVGEGISSAVHSFGQYRKKKWSTIDWVSLNYREGKFDVFGRMQFSSFAHPKVYDKTDQIMTPGAERILVRRGTNDIRANGFFSQLGLNYSSGNHSSGVKYDYNNSYRIVSKEVYDVDIFVDNTLEEQLESASDYLTDNYSHYLNGYYSGKPAEWLDVKLDVDYKTYCSTTGVGYINSYEEKINDRFGTREDNRSDLVGGKLSLNSPVGKGKLLYGIEASYTKNRQRFEVDDEKNISGINSSGNHSRNYLTAGFLSYSQNLGKFSGDIGFRYERADFTYYKNNERVEEQSKIYRNLFPNIRLVYQDEQVQMQLSYRNTVHRPDYSDLRSTVFYNSPYSYGSGNPYLKPTIRKAFSYLSMWKDFTLMLNYTRKQDQVLYLPRLYMGNSILMTYENVNKSSALSSSVGYAPTCGFWKPGLELMVDKEYIKWGDPSAKYNSPTYATRFRNNFDIKGWQLGVTFYACTAGHSSGFYADGVFITSLNLNKSFLNNRILLNVYAYDIFDNSWYQGYYAANNIIQTHNNDWSRRNIYARITYRFNAAKERYKGTRSTDEMNRF